MFKVNNKDTRTTLRWVIKAVDFSEASLANRDNIGVSI